MRIGAFAFVLNKSNLLATQFSNGISTNPSPGSPTPTLRVASGSWGRDLRIETGRCGVPAPRGGTGLVRGPGIVLTVTCHGPLEEFSEGQVHLLIHFYADGGLTPPVTVSQAPDM